MVALRRAETAEPGPKKASHGYRNARQSVLLLDHARRAGHRFSQRRITQIVPGRVSTETDARLSFDVEGSIDKARRLIKLYEDRKIPRERVLIKIASTWEGLKAAP